jgi:Kef-type K+ transport system membrane component KefB
MWLVQLAVIIITCNLCGAVAERMGQCKVVGEILAGIALGPMVVGAISPSFYNEVLSGGAAPVMSDLGELGLVLLMFEVGLDIDFPRGKSLVAPFVISLSGIAIPLIGGAIAALISKDVLAPHAATIPYTLFVGVALSVSAVPVMVRMVEDMGLSQHAGATVALSAAMVGDVFGWLLLSVLIFISHAGSDGAPVLARAVGLLGYLMVFTAVTRRFVRPMIERLLNTDNSKEALSAVVCLGLLSSWATSRLGFHSAFGAFLPGILLRDIPKIRHEWNRILKGFLRTVLIPVFFAYAGLHTSLNGIGHYTHWFWFLIFVAIGVFGKYLGVYAGARIVGTSTGDSFVAATLANARGMMELIVLSIGLQFNIIPSEVYTMLVAFALVTTAVTPPIIRWGMKEQFPSTLRTLR